jgi:asparagine synthase (glutamine-hydrolysing)
MTAMLTSMAHRGPDDRGVETLSDGALVLGHLRLSILDLSPLGHQPMATKDHQTWIVYNGEVYNFNEVKAELRNLGCVFSSETDTEVILAAYRTWGLKAVDRFRGMFAFAIWDARSQELHLCRDRFGVKPLYFSIAHGHLVFASELKGILASGLCARRVRPAAVREFIQFGYVSAPSSILSDVQTVNPGTICTIDRQLRVVEHRYWSARDLYVSEAAQQLRLELAGLDDTELLDRVEASLQESFAYRMVADVPVGVFLSGGIDSSLVAALLVRRSGFGLKTFTIGFDTAEFDESRYARTVATTLGSEHFELRVSAQSLLDTVAEIDDIADEPIGDSSLIPTLVVSRLAREHVKVALSADGADELFGGYARYAYCGDFLERSRALRALYWLSADVMEMLPPAMLANAYAFSRAGGPRFAAISDKLRKFVRMSKATAPFTAYESAVSEWSKEEATALMMDKAPATCSDALAAFDAIDVSDIRDRFMHFDMVRYLPGDLLVKVDRASMSVSLEAREPFLDHHTAKLAAALGMQWKVRGTQNKYILRRLLDRYFSPEFFNRPKQGFSAPIGDWLRGPLRGHLMEQLSTSNIRRHGLLDPETVEKSTKLFLSGRSGTGSAAGMWILIQLQRWASRWLTTAT